MIIIYLSGIDGCGKTTQAKLLTNNLLKNSIDAQYLWFRWEPSLRQFIKALRKAQKHTDPNNKQRIEKENAEQNNWLNYKRNMLANPVFRQLWLYYACVDYYLAYKRLFKNINVDVIVIDRFVNDFIIDQAANLDMGAEVTRDISNNLFLKKFHFPDFSIIIDLPILEGYVRKNDGTPISYLETRKKYYEALQGEKILHLDGLMCIEDLESQIYKWVADKLELQRT